jgi:hypothetical protein
VLTHDDVTIEVDGLRGEFESFSATIVLRRMARRES